MRKRTVTAENRINIVLLQQSNDIIVVPTFMVFAAR